MAKTITKSGPKAGAKKVILGVSVRESTKDALKAYAKSVDRSVSYAADHLLSLAIKNNCK